VNQEEREHNEVDRMKKGVDSKGEVMHIKDKATNDTADSRNYYFYFDLI